MTEVATVERLATHDSLGRRKGGGRPVSKRPPGRPTEYTPEIGKRICKEVAAGIPLTLAAGVVGIKADVVTSWYVRGCDNPKGTFAKFARNVERARALQVRRRVARITKAAVGGQVIQKTTITKANGEKTEREKLQAPQWQADKWLLEVTERELFGPKQVIENIGGANNVTIQQQINPPDLAALAGLLMKVLGGSGSPAHANGQNLPRSLDCLDGTADSLGHGNVLQSLAPSAGDGMVTPVETGQQGVETV